MLQEFFRNGIINKNVKSNQNAMLTGRFSEAEIRMALKTLGKTKAPSPKRKWISSWILPQILGVGEKEFYDNGRLNACVQ